MLKMNKAVTLALLGTAAFPSAFAGYNEYTKTVTDGIADVTLTVNDTIISQKLSGENIRAARFTRSGSFYSVKLRSSGGNDLPDGVMADGYLIKIQNANVLGSGPLQLLNQWSGLYVEYMPNVGDVVDVPTRVEFDTIDAYAAGQDPYGLALHNIGVTAKNTAKVVSLGRTGTGAANVTLSLDGDQNDAIGYFNLRGSLNLTVDGGTIRTAAGDARDLFAKVNEQATPAIKILNAPLTVDTAAGGAVRFGSVVPTFATTRMKDVLREEVKPTNWSFETTSSGWTFVTGAGGAGGYYANNSAFDSNNTYPTTNGTHYAMVRRGGSVYQNVQIATAGKYRVVFERGCRGGNYSKGITLTVSIDDVPLTEFPALSAPTGFTQLETGFVNLTAAAHKLSFALSETAADSYGSMNIDAVRLERYESVPDGGHEIVKTGAGSFIMNDIDKSDLMVDVRNGTFGCENTVLPNAAISVANGAELNAAGLSATGATIDVSAGGAISFSPTYGNLIVNGSFETPTVSDYSYYDEDACKWTLSPSTGSTPGIQKNGGAYSKNPGAYLTPYGNQTLYLRVGTTASQTVKVPTAGEYELVFFQSYRNNYRAPGLQVSVNGNMVLDLAGLTCERDFTEVKVNVTLVKGDNTITFAGVSSPNQQTYSNLFVDNISLIPSVTASDLSETTLQLKSGSIVRLDNAEKVVVGSATVDGVEVNGGAATLRRAGVIVEGEGRIQCGPPRGLMLLVR